MVEAHQQTAHKLEVTGRYFATYASVLGQANASGRLRDASHVTIVDAFAGAGLHGSADHPDGATPGTALQPVLTAYGVQRRFPRTRVHVRLIELDPHYCERLEERVREYAERLGEERVDVVVRRGTFESQVQPVVREVKGFGGGGYALWLVDPYNLEPIPMATLKEIARMRNSELIVNLDSGGINRMFGVVRKRALQHEANAAKLTATFGSSIWRTALEDYPAAANRSCDAFAAAYATAIPEYAFGVAYPLRTSNSQFRHLVRFAGHPIAVKKFRKDYAATQRTGFLKGRALTEAERARYADILHGLHKGSTTFLNDLYEAQDVALDRGQFRTVMRYAALPSNGFGAFDEETGAFTWCASRRRPVALSRSRKADADAAHPSLFGGT